jgi:hypothetical protein
MTGIHLCDTCAAALCSQCRSIVFRSPESIPTRTGSSSHSIESSDSAFCDHLNDGLSHGNNSSESLL